MHKVGRYFKKFLSTVLLRAGLIVRSDQVIYGFIPPFQENCQGLQNLWLQLIAYYKEKYQIEKRN